MRLLGVVLLVSVGCSKKDKKLQVEEDAPAVAAVVADARAIDAEEIDAPPPPPPVDAATGDEPVPGATPVSCTYNKEKSCMEWLPPSNQERADQLVGVCGSQGGDYALSGCAKRHVKAECVTPRYVHWRYYNGADLKKSQASCTDFYKGEWRERK